MFSAPPARTNSAWPSWISCAARMIACKPEPQSRFTVRAGDSLGTPDFRPMWRAKYTASPEVWRTLPKMTCSICFGSTLDFSSAPFAAMTPRSVAEVSRSAPPYVPKAVRAPSMMTMSFTDGSRAASTPLPSIVASRVRLEALSPSLWLRRIQCSARSRPDLFVGPGRSTTRGCSSRRRVDPTRRWCCRRTSTESFAVLPSSCLRLREARLGRSASSARAAPEAGSPPLCGSGSVSCASAFCTPFRALLGDAPLAIDRRGERPKAFDDGRDPCLGFREGDVRVGGHGTQLRVEIPHDLADAVWRRGGIVDGEEHLICEGQRRAPGADVIACDRHVLGRDVSRRCAREVELQRDGDRLAVGA